MIWLKEPSISLGGLDLLALAPLSERALIGRLAATLIRRGSYTYGSSVLDKIEFSLLLTLAESFVQPSERDVFASALSHEILRQESIRRVRRNLKNRPLVISRRGRLELATRRRILCALQSCNYPKKCQSDLTPSFVIEFGIPHAVSLRYRYDTIRELDGWVHHLRVRLNWLRVLRYYPTGTTTISGEKLAVADIDPLTVVSSCQSGRLSLRQLE